MAHMPPEGAPVPDVLIVVLIPPLLIVVTLLLAHVERRVTTSRQRPRPPAPGAARTRSRRRRMTLVERIPTLAMVRKARDRDSHVG
jgi:hypothetical protein